MTADMTTRPAPVSAPALSDAMLARERAGAFAQEHLKQCCKELVSRDNTGILVVGKVRELSMLCGRYVGKEHGLVAAESMVNRLALRQVAQES